MSVYTLGDARRDHPKYFEADGFFGSRYLASYEGDGFVYVVSTEQPPNADPTFNVHRFSGERSETIGPRLDIGWGGLEQAKAVAKKLWKAEQAGRVVVREDVHLFAECDWCLGEITAEQPEGSPRLTAMWATFVYYPYGESLGLLTLCCDEHLARAVLTHEED